MNQRALIQEHRRRRFVQRTRSALWALAGVYMVSVILNNDIKPWRGRVIGAERRGDQIVAYRMQWGVIHEDFHDLPRTRFAELLQAAEEQDALSAHRGGSDGRDPQPPAVQPAQPDRH